MDIGEWTVRNWVLQNDSGHQVSQKEYNADEQIIEPGHIARTRK